MTAIRTALALLLLLPAVAGAEVWTKSFPADDRPTVRVSTSDAKVTVRASNRETVDARVELTGRATGLYFGKVTPRVVLERKGDVIEIRAHLVGGGAGIRVSTHKLTVDVSIPLRCDLEVRTSDGPVNVEGVRGRIDVSTSDGRITLRDVHGDIRLHTSDGPVVAEDLDGKLSGHASDGTLRVRGRFDDLDLETQDGGLRVDAEPGSKIENELRLTTTDGGLDLTIPSALRATLDARVRDGHLDLDLPARKVERYAPREVRIDLNGGGPLLRVRSSDGSVKIRTRS
jgi:hypothetical protein